MPFRVQLILKMRPEKKICATHWQPAQNRTITERVLLRCAHRGHGISGPQPPQRTACSSWRASLSKSVPRNMNQGSPALASAVPYANGNSLNALNFRLRRSATYD